MVGEGGLEMSQWRTRRWFNESINVAQELQQWETDFAHFLTVLCANFEKRARKKKKKKKKKNKKG